MTGFAEVLKSWRQVRRFSQLDLALEADVSARHVSFLETGRARPSREMVTRLGEALTLPLDARNRMMTAAGFAARYGGRDWQEAEMAPIRKAIDTMLTNHLPYPAFAVDRLWTIRAANDPGVALFAPFGVGVGDSLLDLMLSDALPQVVENWPDVAHHAALRLRTESVAQGGVAELDRAADRLSGVTGVRTTSADPVIPTILRLGDMRLSMFATIAQFGTPEDVTLDDLKIELYFPMDDRTEAFFRGS